MYKVGQLQLSDNQRCQMINAALSGLIFTDSIVEQIKQVFISEMELALNEQPSSLQMENTYIPELPDGTEKGLFLALDLGGTNFRVILMELHHLNITREEVKHYHIPDSLRIGCGDKLFDYLAECVDDFVKEKNLLDLQLPLGFTFSFPMKQHSLDSGSLVTWTKSFNCPSTVGQDVVKKLRQSLQKCGRDNIKVVAILNDTTGTLIQGARLDKNTRIGIVLGTGTNGCYVEHADRVKHWETQRHGEKNVIIDVEWGAFGDNGVLDFIKTDFDREVDDGSLLKNSFTFEKYIGGKYLGELCRVILHSLLVKKLFLPNADRDKFPKPWKFGSDNVSKIEQDAVDGKNQAEQILLNLGYIRGTDFDDDDMAILRYVCGLISERAAKLLAINTSILLNRMDEKDITIAIDGSVYKHHPRLRDWIQKYTSLWTPTKKCKFMLAEDGSGKGAALISAIAQKIQERNY